MDLNKWKVLSILVPIDNIDINVLDMLGLQYFDTNHTWNHPKLSTYTWEIAPKYFNYRWRSGEVIHNNTPLHTLTNTLFHNQQLAFDTVLQNSQVQGPKEPLRMIIQGTKGTCKSYLISTIKKHCLLKQPLVIAHYCSSPLLVLQRLTYMQQLNM